MQLSSISDDELVDIFGEIGMIDKPVHVLRFQKTLNEWNTNPQEIVANFHRTCPKLDPKLFQTWPKLRPSQIQTCPTDSNPCLIRLRPVLNLPNLFQTCLKNFRLKLSEMSDSNRAKTRPKSHLTLSQAGTPSPVSNQTKNVSNLSKIGTKTDPNMIKTQTCPKPKFYLI